MRTRTRVVSDLFLCYVSLALRKGEKTDVIEILRRPARCSSSTETELASLTTRDFGGLLPGPLDVLLGEGLSPESLFFFDNEALRRKDMTRRRHTGQEAGGSTLSLRAIAR